MDRNDKPFDEIADVREEALAPYYGLDPNHILGAIESLGLRCDGRLLALNSYENRVYQVGIEDGAPLVAKFYRPARWSDEAILEEHAYTLELAEQELPVIAPLRDPAGRSLHHHGGYRFAVYPRRGGRHLELDDVSRLTPMGRFMARIHNIGALRPFAHRPALSVEHFGEESYRFVLEQSFVPADLVMAYRSVAEDVLMRVRACFRRAGEIDLIRLHGDCHPGNVLWTDDGPHFVDFDDCRMGPAVQDLWMLLSGGRSAMTLQLAYLLDGYSDFRELNPRELHLIEALRTLRMLHHSAWIARRWGDPAFPRAFPWFDLPRYWEDQILALREQAALMDEPPLAWD